MGLTALDIVVILLILAGGIIGWLRGFVFEVVSLLAWGLVFLGGKLASRRLGSRVRQSVVGPLDRVLGAGFGALKGLIGATLLFLALSLVDDTIWGRAAVRPEWMTQSRTYPLLKSSGATFVDLVEAGRSQGTEANSVDASSANAQ